MVIFEDGQDVMESLSDESIYASPDTETEEESPERTSQESEVVAEEESPERTSQESEPGHSEAEWEALNKQVRDLRNWATRLSMENGELRRSKEVPEEKPKAENGKDFVKELLAKGSGALSPLIEEKMNEALRPYREREEQARRTQEFNKAFGEVSKFYSQLGSREGKEQVIQKVVDLSVADGDATAWQKDPKRYVFNACMELYGVAKVVDQDAINAAVKAERDRIMASAHGKVGLAANTTANRDAGSVKRTPEEQILFEMENISKRGIFD